MFVFCLLFATSTKQEGQGEREAIYCRSEESLEGSIHTACFPGLCHRDGIFGFCRQHDHVSDPSFLAGCIPALVRRDLGLDSNLGERLYYFWNFVKLSLAQRDF